MTRWTANDIPDQTGRLAVVTGASSGIGLHIAGALAAKGARIILAVRDLERGRAAQERIIAESPKAALDLQELDLTSLLSIRNAAKALIESTPQIDLLINNAGVMFTPRSSTSDGFELQLGPTTRPFRTHWTAHRTPAKSSRVTGSHLEQPQPQKPFRDRL